MAVCRQKRLPPMLNLFFVLVVCSLDFFYAIFIARLSITLDQDPSPGNEASTMQRKCLVKCLFCFCFVLDLCVNSCLFRCLFSLLFRFVFLFWFRFSCLIVLSRLFASFLGRVLLLGFCCVFGVCCFVYCGFIKRTVVYFACVGQMRCFVARKEHMACRLIPPASSEVFKCTWLTCKLAFV